MKRNKLEREIESCKKIMDNLSLLVDALKWVIEHPTQIKVEVEPGFKSYLSSESCSVKHDSFLNLRSTSDVAFFHTVLKLTWYDPKSTSIKKLDAVVVRDCMLHLLGHTFNNETGEFTCEFRVSSTSGKHTYKYAVNLYQPINSSTIKLSYVCAGNRECPAVLYQVENGNRVHIS